MDAKTLKVCSCNRTVPVDAAALARALGGGAPVHVHEQLCRRDVAAFQSVLGEEDVVVACTQEAPLFGELAEEAGSKARLRFVNVRELAGWSRERAAATPKMAALIAMAALPDPEPAPAVAYRSGGEVLVIGPDGPALDWAERLSGSGLGVSVLATRAQGAELPATRAFPVWSGKVTRLAGWLGSFEVEWTQENPIDLELCTRCNACVDACPEGAIGFDYQVDSAKCRSHRRCVAACADVGAIDFSRAERARGEKFDLVLDLSAEPLLRTPTLPQGYFAPGSDPLEQALAAAKLAQLVGEFEKPRFFAYREKICAHGRSGITGCTRCIDTCSAGAIRSDGERVHVEPHLCAGCGGCSTVCPSGAMSYAYPKLPDLGLRLRTMLGAYREAGGRDACLLFHDATQGRAALQSLGRHAVRGGRGLPARVLPFEVFSAASVGLDLMLGALCYGASQVLVLGTENVAPYADALRDQMALAQSILKGLGYEGTHFSLAQAEEPVELEARLWDLLPATTAARPATFHFAADKRGTLDFALEHLARHAPRPQEVLPLPAGAPFGTLEVNKEACTLCKACVGACPESALIDATEAPALRFIEWNCVQCGLCANTCPEDAIRLVPRLLLGAPAKAPVTLNEAEPFDCVRCGKPFGTRTMVERMTARLSTHSMFAGGLRRLQMCADCRVIDMMDNRNESSIFDYRK